MKRKPAYFVSVAPMMDWTDRHCRYMLRLISQRALLYTEMITVEAIMRGDRQGLLGFDDSEHPVALQLGGSDPRLLAECARIGADWGYDEINLNVGCPSDRVQSGRFGACLMREPKLVAQCVESMASVVDLPITVKSRIGVDNQDEWSSLSTLARHIHEAGASRHIVHARKAWLRGLSPKQNREIPPLRYDIVYRLKMEMPEMTIVANGGIGTLEEIDLHMSYVDGVMLGRAAYQNPFILAMIDRFYFDSILVPRSRRDVGLEMLDYIEKETVNGTPLRAITRHMFGLFQGLPGARAWRRCLSETAHAKPEPIKAIRSALDSMPSEKTAAAA